MESTEGHLLTHAVIMSDLRKWLDKNTDIKFVDFSRKINDQRHLLTSWVHLNKRANRIMAEELADVILKKAC